MSGCRPLRNGYTENGRRAKAPGGPRGRVCSRPCGACRPPADRNLETTRRDTLCDRCARGASRAGVEVSPSTMLPRVTTAASPTKKSLHDSQRDSLRVPRLRRLFRQRIAEEWSTGEGRLKFLDESGVNLGLPSRFGRTRPSQRVMEGPPLEVLGLTICWPRRPASRDFKGDPVAALVESADTMALEFTSKPKVTIIIRRLVFLV